MTVFRENVRRHPDKVVFYYENQCWTFRQLELYSNQVANCFIQQGFKPGDEVALLLESRPEYVGLWLGLAKAGIIAALVNTNQRSQILIHSITVIKCKALIFGNDFSSGEQQHECRAHVPLNGCKRAQLSASCCMLIALMLLMSFVAGCGFRSFYRTNLTFDNVSL